MSARARVNVRAWEGAHVCVMGADLDIRPLTTFCVRWAPELSLVFSDLQVLQRQQAVRSQRIAYDIAVDRNPARREEVSRGLPKGG